MLDVIKVIFKKETMILLPTTLFFIGFFIQPLGELIFPIFTISMIFNILIKESCKRYLSQTKNKIINNMNTEEIGLKSFFITNYVLTIPILLIIILSFVTNNLWTKETINLNNEKIELLISSHQIKNEINYDSYGYSSIGQIAVFIIKMQNIKPIDSIMNQLANKAKTSWELGKNLANLLNEYHLTKKTKPIDKV